MRIPIKKLFENDNNVVLVMDGGQGTELEARGINVTNPVWSTVPFIDDSFWNDLTCKNRKIVQDMFKDFIDAGADILMTTTYQASFKSVSENTEIKTLKEYSQLMERIILFCRSCIGEDKYLIGCIGAWGAHICAEFSGDYGPTPQEIDYLSYFKPQLESFNTSEHIDLIGFETIPNFHELRAILSWDETILTKPFYIAISVHEHGVLRDGTPMHVINTLLQSLGDTLNQNLMFIGINCCAFNQSHMLLESLRQYVPDLPLIVYPNSGEIYDTVNKSWISNDLHAFTWDELVKNYLQTGAKIIGGCCRTSVSDIRSIRKAVDYYYKR